MADAPYKQSRAALRNQFGSRAIDARAPQADPNGNLPLSGRQNTPGDAVAWGARFKTSPWADQKKLENPNDPMVKAEREAMGVTASVPDAPAPLTGYLGQAARAILTGGFAAGAGAVNQGFSFGGSDRFSTPSIQPTLTEMAAGGSNSATAWQNAASKPRTSRVGRFGTISQTPGVPFKRLESDKYGWGYSRRGG